MMETPGRQRMETSESEGRVKVSLILDRDQIAWLNARARQLSVSRSAVARQAIRAAMDAAGDARRDGTV